MSTEVVAAWLGLPRRPYLDTSTLQTIFDFGEEVWDGVPFDRSSKAASVPGLEQEVYALRYIFEVNGRASFHLVVTEASLSEVAQRGDGSYSRWVRDVEDSWLVAGGADAFDPRDPTLFAQRRFGNISSKDRRMLQSAHDNRCDAFLTMERRLPTQAAFLERATGLLVMRPTTYWRMLLPWAALYH